MITRRQALKTTVLAAAACAAASTVRLASAAAPAAPAGPFTLPPLPYGFDALEPHIDARTMEIHHDKHHAAYVANLNKAVADYPDLGKKSPEELIRDLGAVPEKVRLAVRNNAGGDYNHTLFWQMMKRDGGGAPKGELAKAIEAQFGTFGGFKEKFIETATKVFGSGWAWLTIQDGTLKLESTPNQDSPGMSAKPTPEEEALRKRFGLPAAPSGGQPILGLDVWEHAYYLKYQNRRPDYLAAWFNVVNWDFATERYLKLKG
jgi:superoxide dismutase, Fe-Mn family